MAQPMRPRLVAQQNDRTIQVRKLASEIGGSDWDDDEPTRPGIEGPPPARARMPSIQDGAEERAATFLERVLGTVPPAWRFPSLVVILGFALAVFYLWKTLP
jgi:hypothetical protein